MTTITVALEEMAVVECNRRCHAIEVKQLHFDAFGPTLPSAPLQALQVESRGAGFAPNCGMTTSVPSIKGGRGAAAVLALHAIPHCRVAMALGRRDRA
jgi:hypothetical protein